MKLNCFFLILLVLIIATGCSTVQKPANEPVTEDEIRPVQAAEADIPKAETLQEEVKPSQAAQQPAAKLPETKLKSVDIPPSIEDNCIGFLVGNPGETATVKLIGGGWARPHPGPFSWGHIEPVQGEYDFRYTDDFVMHSQENNISILATIWPFANWDQDSKCKVGSNDMFYPRPGAMAIPEYRCKPKDMQAYRKFLSKLVERYDGDGKEDMPGLSMPIKYWEVLNEPEMKSAELTFFKGNEEDYIDVLKESYEAIKQECNDCNVVQGGAAGSSPEFLSFWDKVLESGGGKYFDIANIHFISVGDASTFNVEPFSKVLERHNVNKPIWVTEAQPGSPGSVKSSVKGAFAAGASKVFFVKFKIGSIGPPKPGEHSKEFKEAVELCQ